MLQVRTAEDAGNVLKHKAATLLAIEEGGAIDGSLEALRCLYELGVRAMTLTWSNRNDIADGINEEATGSGLTVFRQTGCSGNEPPGYAGRCFPHFHSRFLERY